MKSHTHSTLQGKSGNRDRTELVPSHEGLNVFPNCSFFSKLLRHARRNRVAVRDANLGVVKTYGDILSDALTLRLIIAKALGPEILYSIEKGDEVFVGILAAGGYEFTIAVLAVLALGAAIVPMTVSVPVKEASYFVIKSRQPLILVSSEVVELGKSTRDFVLEQGHRVSTLEILPHLPAAATYSPLQMVLSSNRRLDDNRAGVVIFTSGTTGRPKGAVMRRAYIHETALAIGEGYDIDHNDVLLHVIPVHHTTGLGTSFFPFLMAGACIEFKRGSFDAAWIWSRWLKGGLTTFSAVPTISLRLKWHFEQELAPKLAVSDLARYVEAANQFRAFMCGSSALQQPVQDFWTGIRGGRPILTRYGATEFPGCLKVPADAGTLPKGCVGLPVPGVELKLTEGDHGELLVRSPYMFAKYLYDDAATLAAHDEDGFFKTGDIARRSGPYYFIEGRASVDIIKSGGYKISALDIERVASGLPYVNEVAVVGVEDEEFGQRVGVIVALKPNTLPENKLKLDTLRQDLRRELASYKLPTLLRVFPTSELPKGGTGKIQKKILGPELFPSNWRDVSEVQKWDSSNNKKRGCKKGKSVARL